MNYSIETLANFDRELKKLAKKYASLKSEVALLAATLMNELYYYPSTTNRSRPTLGMPS